MSATTNFSLQFAQRWLNTPMVIKQTIIHELDDIIKLLQTDTDLDSFRFQVDDLSTTIDHLMNINQPTITEFSASEQSPITPTKPKTSAPDSLIAKQQQNEARLVKQLTEQTKINELLPNANPPVENPTFTKLQNPFNHDIEQIKQQIIHDIKQQLQTDVKSSLLTWLHDEVEKQVNAKLKDLL